MCVEPLYHLGLKKQMELQIRTQNCKKNDTEHGSLHMEKKAEEMEQLYLNTRPFSLQMLISEKCGSLNDHDLNTSQGRTFKSPVALSNQRFSEGNP
jgi:hypothetical protein